MLDFNLTYIVDGTLWALVAFSVATWALILVKGIQNLRSSYFSRRYKRQFWSASDLNAAAGLKDDRAPAARLAQAGFGALRDADRVADLEHDGDRQYVLERYLRQQLQKERHGLESGLAILASIGSTSPFVGLFGTVWGIMHALHDIGANGSASLETVAGPIGEALLATGVGIAVAVPAVLAYNYFVRRCKLVNADLEDFATDLVNIAQRSNFRLAPAKAEAANNSSSKDSDKNSDKASGKDAGVIRTPATQPKVFA
ncbi:MAG TPA: MotA/TolQ/ExbB proton channel family protein [Dongiaceae bacterium]|nr:MotA/TolQ/ExbB proton channel family protein [Dongiaceae bacterium]